MISDFPPSQATITNGNGSSAVKPTRGRPRRTMDGFIKEGVVHGKQSSYNRGCRCLACTTANREAVANRKAAKQAKTAKPTN